MYKQIVVPLDGSTFAEAALPLALALSTRTKATLHLVTVVEPIPAFAHAKWESAAKEWSEEYLPSVSKRISEHTSAEVTTALPTDSAAKEWSEEYLSSVSERISGHSGAEVTTALRTGHVLETLLAETRAREADVVVMATHGRGALSRAWLESVADGFVHQADWPIILIRPEEGEAPPTTLVDGFKTLLVPLDGSKLSERALDYAIEFGELFGSAYHLTRVVSPPLNITSPYLPHTVQMNQNILADEKAGSAEYLEGHAERMRRRGLRRHCDGDARTYRGQPSHSRERGGQGPPRYPRTSLALSTRQDKPLTDEERKADHARGERHHAD